MPQRGFLVGLGVAVGSGAPDEPGAALAFGAGWSETGDSRVLNKPSGVAQVTFAAGGWDWPFGVDGWVTYMPRMSAIDGRAPRVDHWLR